MPCLADDDMLELVRGGALGDAPAAEAHLADCPACSALLATLVAGADAGAAPDWGALVGRRFGSCRLEAQIGAGTSGAVYRAHDEHLRRTVAVKVLSADPAYDRWAETEVRAAAAINHRNVVAVHSAGREGGHGYVVTELVEGESLRSLLARGPLPSARVQALALDLARGLAAAHAAGVIHRDLKPENLLVTRDGTLKILDFGLAKLAADAGGLDATIPGTVLGTVGYMAPEQARGEAVDARADVFAAGAIVYEMATGRRAFDGATHADRLGAVLRDMPPADQRMGALAPIVMRCLAKAPAARFQSAEDLAWVLAPLAASEPRRSEAKGASRRTLLLGSGAAAAAGALGFALGRWSTRTPGRPSITSPRQLTFRQGRLMSARFARRGDEVFFGAAWDDAPLAAQALRLEGGTARTLALPPADVLAVSHTQLALALDRKHVDGQSATGRLALVPIDGGVPRELRADVQEADFSPDGAALAVVARAARASRLMVDERVVLERSWITHPRFSPDGRRVACLVHPDPNDDQGALVEIDRATGTARVLSDAWSSIAGLAWSPRGDEVWITASRGQADNAIHAVSLRGRERTLFATIGRLRLHDVDAAGRALISRDVWRLRSMVGGDGAPEVDRSLTPISLVVDLAPDGSSLLVGELGDVDEVNGIYVTPASGGQRLHLGPGWPRARSRDGQRIFATGFERVATGHPDAMVITVGSGDRTPVALAPVADLRDAAWLDERTLLVGGAAAGRPARLWRVTLGGTAATPVTAEGMSGAFAVDATGTRVAFVDPADRLQLLTLDGTPARIVGPPLPDHRVCGWHGAQILVRTTYAPITIRRIDPLTGAASPHAVLTPPALGQKGVDAVVLAEDGVRHAYSYGQELSQLFLVDLRAA